MDALKGFQQKIKNRKFAIDHSWMADENWGEVETEKSLTGHCSLVPRNKVAGEAIFFIKRVIRKLFRIYGEILSAMYKFYKREKNALVAAKENRR